MTVPNSVGGTGSGSTGSGSTGFGSTGSGSTGFEDTALDVDAVLLGLADPTRRRILGLLVDAGQATATVLAVSMPVSRQAVTKHLQVLAAAGLVASSRKGREVRYAPRDGALDASARWLSGLAATWDARLLAVKLAAESARPETGDARPRARAAEQVATAGQRPTAPSGLTTINR